MKALLDHEWFEFRSLPEIVDWTLPGKARIALLPVLMIQSFPLTERSPYPVPGGLDRPYPDFGNWTQRQVGLRDGLWRFLDLIDEIDIPVTFVVDALALSQFPELVSLVRTTRHAVVAGGEHAVRLHGPQLTLDEERTIIGRTLAAIEETIGRRPMGWRSPYGAHSPRTLALLAQAGLHYFCDFANDDRPYEVFAAQKSLNCVPMNYFMGDIHSIGVAKHSTSDYVLAMGKGVDWLLNNTLPNSPCVFPLLLHPWLAGVPHRFDAIARLLRSYAVREGVRIMNSDEISQSFTDSRPKLGLANGV